MNEEKGESSRQYHYGAEDFQALYRHIGLLTIRVEQLEGAIKPTQKIEGTGTDIVYTADETDSYKRLNEIEQAFRAGQVSGENKITGRPFQTPTGYLKSVY